MKLDLFIPGTPKPGGSKRPFMIRNKAGLPVMKNGRPLIVVTDTSGKAGRDWRADVRCAVQAAYPGDPMDTSFWVMMVFHMQRPKSHYGSGKNAAVLKGSAPDFHMQDPDALKLARSVEDALTGVLWKDDNRIVTETIKKVWDVKCGMYIAVSTEGPVA